MNRLKNVGELNSKVKSQKVKIKNYNKNCIFKDRSINGGPTNALMLKIEGLEKNKSIVYARQTINNLAANALEFFYHLHIKKLFSDKSEFFCFIKKVVASGFKFRYSSKNNG